MHLFTSDVYIDLLFTLGITYYPSRRSTMNQLEINLALWAICSILLFEILIIICLCRCCFNRIRPRKFYVKVSATARHNGFVLFRF